MFAVFGALTLQALLPAGGLAHRPAAASLGSWLETQTLRTSSRPTSQKPPLIASSGHSFARPCERRRVLWLWALRAKWPLSPWACGEGGTSTEPPLVPACRVRTGRCGKGRVFVPRVQRPHHRVSCRPVILTPPRPPHLAFQCPDCCKSPPHWLSACCASCLVDPLPSPW